MSAHPEDAADPKTAEANAPHHQFDTILIIDFGSQYTHLILRRLRYLSIYCEIVSPYDDLSTLKFKPVGVFRQLFTKLSRLLTDLVKFQGVRPRCMRRMLRMLALSSTAGTYLAWVYAMACR